jgi:Cu(I)/Ag(I) efflux system periplasmic protein CusF
MNRIFIFFMVLVTHAVYASEWTKGEIRRLDLENNRVTIKHEEIKNLNMPPMSMVFVVEDPQQLQALNLGDHIEFVADQQGKKFLVKQIKKLE